MTETSPVAKSHDGRWLRCGLVVGVHFLMMLMVILALGALVPTFTLHFERAGLTIPWITACLISLSQYVVSYWYLLMILGMGLDITAMVYLTRNADHRRSLRSLYEYACLLGVSLLLFWILLCLAMTVQIWTTVRLP